MIASLDILCCNPLILKNKITKIEHKKILCGPSKIKEVNKLSIKKASLILDIAVKIIKENKDLISYFVYNNFNNALSSLQYPNGLKYADVTPVFKKDDKSDRINYRPISILPSLSKVYKRIMQN